MAWSYKSENNGRSWDIYYVYFEVTSSRKDLGYPLNNLLYNNQSSKSYSHVVPWAGDDLEYAKLKVRLSEYRQGTMGWEEVDLVPESEIILYP